MDTEYNPPIDISHTQTEKRFRIKHTNKNPDFFVIDKLSNDYITNHNEKYCLFLNKCDFKLIFINDFSKSIHIGTHFYHNATFINLRRLLIHHNDNFIDMGYIFSHIDEMNITTIDDRMYMTYTYYIQNPMPAVELKMNMILAKNPHFTKSLNRPQIHPLIRKYSYIRLILILINLFH